MLGTGGSGAYVFVYLGILSAQQLQNLPHPTAPGGGVIGSRAQHPPLQHPEEAIHPQHPAYIEPKPNPTGACIPRGPM